MSILRPSPFLRTLLAATLVAAWAPLLHATDARPTSPDDDVFTLGQMTVTGQKDDESPVGTSVIKRDALQALDRDGLPEALALVPGVTVTAGAGSRNEAVISVRGFDRWQVPLLLDGIRLYLPADNRIDFDRFLTPDLSAIQVSKGFVSVLNGPDGMGGAINLVTRRPVQPFEAEVRTSAALASQGQYNGHTVYTHLGSRVERFYAQVSVEQRDLLRWRLSRDFVPTAAENGGVRDHTSKNDWRLNVKAGFTPTAGDEYSINYVKQSGDKHGVGAVTGTSAISTWDWPWWDTTSLYWLSQTQLGADRYIKTRAYYNTFDNGLVAYTNTSLTTPNWTSIYDDNARGASVEFGARVLGQHELKAAAHYRRDTHTEWQITHATGFVEPRQTTIEDTYSVALEDTWHLAPQWDLIGGVSRDERSAKQAQEFANAVLFNQPIADSGANNAQMAAIYRYRPSGKLHLAVSDRTRFPTMFERFSSRFGGALSNPWIKPERALNIEIGVADDVAPGLRGEATLFHHQVDDAIQSVPISYNGATYSQSQNVGQATFKGLELALDYRASETLSAGINYTYLETDVDNPNDPSARLTTSPRHKAFLYARWRPIPALQLIPSVESASDRWSSKAVGSGYTKTGAYSLVNVKADYQITRQWSVALSARNLMDQNYQVVDGYPQEGRNFLVSTRVQF